MKEYSKDNVIEGSGDNILEELKKEYPEVEFIKIETEINGEIVVFAALFLDEHHLTDNWSDLSSSVAIHYQTLLEDEFKKWNTYLIYLCKGSVNRSLRYQIENDKFANRKIVYEGFQLGFTKSSIEELIHNRVLNHLSFTSEKGKRKKSLYASSSPIWKFITQIGDSRKNDDIIETTLSQIETALKNENK